MRRSTSGRVAGFTLLFYIAVAFPSMVLMKRATSADGVQAQLARVAEHASDVRVAIVLTILSCLSALLLAVTLHAITRDEDREVAALILVCRVVEGALGAIGIPETLGLLWLAEAGSGAAAPDGATVNALGTLFLAPARGAMLGAPFFAVGSLAFAWLAVRGRVVPVALGWIGVGASALLVVSLPLQLAGFVSGPWAAYVWLPMLAFEVPLGLWLLVRGVPPSGATGGCETQLADRDVP